MALDRSKFKATSVAATIQKDEQLSTQLGRDGGIKTDYIKFENGTNVLRIYPPHPEEDGGGDVYAEPKVVVFLPMMVVQKDDKGQDMVDAKTRRPIMKESLKSVFNSRVHGGTSKDLVEEYIAFSRQNLEEEIKQCQDSKTKLFLQDKLEAITGNFMKKKQGLSFKQAWVMYVDKITGSTAKFGILEIGKAIKERLNSIAASTDTTNDPLATDPFTDIESGRAIIVNYNKDAQKPVDYYKTELDNAMIAEVIAGKTYQMPRTYPLSDDQLERFSKATPLAKRFKNCFKKRDFELQMEGLEFFDQKNQIGTWDNPIWLNICEEIAAYYPDEEDVAKLIQDNEQNEQPLGVDQTIIKTQEPSGDQFDLMTRKELAAFAKLNQTGIVIKPIMSDDQVRDFIREWNDAQNVVVNVIEEENDNEGKEEVSSTIVETTTDRLAALRAKVSGK